MITKNYISYFNSAVDYNFRILKSLFEDKRILNLCNTSIEFDVVITEAYKPIMLAFGEKFHAPTIALFSMEAMQHIHSYQGNPVHSLLYTDFVLDFTKPLSIFRKIYYCYVVLYKYIYTQTVFINRSNQLKNKYFGHFFPNVEKLIQNLSLVFVNSNPILNQIRPLTPSTIQLGFMHIEKIKALPKDLKTILDVAQTGVVYFSLGSNVKSSGLPPETVKVIAETLSELPYTVLWKWESDDVPNVGQNVVTKKWFPQQDILAHPNVKGFVTQGGLQSTEEAIIYGVPMVGIPFFCDQEMNVRKSEKLGIAIYLDKTTMTKNSLRSSILEIMKNTQYREKIKELQKIAKDQPMTGLERAVWWTEYVIRHKGARHLRSPAADISLFEYLLLDVILVVLCGLLITSFIVYKVIQILIRFIRIKVNSKVKTT